MVEIDQLFIIGLFWWHFPCIDEYFTVRQWESINWHHIIQNLEWVLKRPIYLTTINQCYHTFISLAISIIIIRFDISFNLLYVLFDTCLEDFSLPSFHLINKRNCIHIHRYIKLFNVTFLFSNLIISHHKSLYKIHSHFFSHSIINFSLRIIR